LNKFLIAGLLVSCISNKIVIEDNGSDDDDDQRSEGDQQGDCTDEVDNDEDGDIDCEDSGCSGKPGCAGTDTGTDTDTDQVGNPHDSFSITISGVANETLTFDSPSCGIPDSIPKLDLFWRDTSLSHVFVFRLTISGFDGPGEYNNTDHSVTLRLQQEAGGSNQFYQADAGAGDGVSVTVESDDNGTFWGEFSVSTLNGGEISLSPMVFPIWCTPENTQN